MQGRIGVFGLSRWSLPIGDSAEHESNLHDGLQFKCSLLLSQFLGSHIRLKPIQRMAQLKEASIKYWPIL